MWFLPFAIKNLLPFEVVPVCTSNPTVSAASRSSNVTPSITSAAAGCVINATQAAETKKS
jgi:hypothetical protein